MFRIGFVIPVGIVLLLLFSGAQAPTRAAGEASPIKHVIVIVMENHSFDNYFGTYPDANGFPRGVALPVKIGGPGVVKPFPLQRDSPWGDVCHSWECAINEFDVGKMDGFVYTAGTNLTMGYFDHHQIPYYWDYASQYVLMDNYYSSVLGSSLPNHLYLVAAQSGGKVDNLRNATFKFPSIFEELQAAQVSWRYYAQLFASGWNPLPEFASFIKNANLTKGIGETPNFPGDVLAGRLPSVSFIMPSSATVSEHPPQNVTAGQDWVVSLVNDVMRSQFWDSSAIFVTWDESGGWYDHVPPPQVDNLGYGFRVPTLIISPYARHGYIDHTQADHTSILKFIETLNNLQPLTTRDASAADLMEAFDFTQAPRAPLILPGPYVPEHYPLTLRPGLSNLGGTITNATLGAPTRPLSIGDLQSTIILAVAGSIGLTLLGFFARRRV